MNAKWISIKLKGTLYDMYIIFPVLTFPVPRFQSRRRWRGVGRAAEQIEIAVVVTTIRNDGRGRGPADRQQAVEFIKPGRLSALIAPHTHTWPPTCCSTIRYGRYEMLF